MEISLLYFGGGIDSYLQWINQFGNWRVLNPKVAIPTNEDVIIIPDNVPRNEFSYYIDPWVESNKKILCLGRAADCLVSYMGGQLDYKRPSQVVKTFLVGNHPTLAMINDGIQGYHATAKSEILPEIVELPPGVEALAFHSRQNQEAFLRSPKVPTKGIQIFSDHKKFWGIKCLPHLIDNLPNSYIYSQTGFSKGDKISNQILQGIKNPTYNGESENGALRIHL